MTTARASWWLVTINNPTQVERDYLIDPIDVVKEMWYQDEIGESGTLHIQLCLNTINVRWTQIKSWLGPQAHIEASRNSSACKNYCKKGKTAVIGTFTHWKRESNTIEEPPPTFEQQTEIMALLFFNLPYNLELWEEGPEGLYNHAVSNVLERDINRLGAVTAPRVSHNFRIAFQPMLEFIREYAQELTCEENPSSVRPSTECQITDDGPWATWIPRTAVRTIIDEISINAPPLPQPEGPQSPPRQKGRKANP
nr:MAG: replication associated protein [Cressdnaviricota sp.]